MADRKLEALPHLATFQALFDHHGVSAAASALGITQSAVSKQLSKLRRTYGDALFVRTPTGMQPTPRALEMKTGVATILAQAEALLDAKRFDPRDLTGEITISTTDEVRLALVPEVVTRLEQQAPRLRLTIISLERDYSHRQLESGAVDLVVSVNWHAPDPLKQSLLWDDEFVCVMGADHSLATSDLTVAAYAAADHVMVAPLGMRFGVVDELLAEKGLRRFIRLSVPDFIQITPDVLSRSHLATLPSRVADFIAGNASGRIVIRPLPFDQPRIQYFALWHPRFERDQRHLWLRSLVRDVLWRAKSK